VSRRDIEHLTNIQEGEQYDVPLLSVVVLMYWNYRELALQGLKVLLIEKFRLLQMAASSSPSKDDTWWLYATWKTPS